MIPRHPNKQKAVDEAIWRNYNYRFHDKPYGVVLSSKGDYMVVSKEHPSFTKYEFEKFINDFTKMDYKHIQQIAMDEDPLPHWEEIRGMFSTTHGETLRFILNAKVPLEKFLRYELACRGYDENFQWIGFTKAEKLWLK